MTEQIKQDMHESTIYDDYLTTSLITLKSILENIDEITIIINNKKKQLETEKTNELELREAELRIMTLRTRYHRRPNKIDEEIDLRRETKKKIDSIEKLKEKVVIEWEFKNFEILKNLNYAIYDEIDEIAKIELELDGLGVLKKSINFSKKSIIPKDLRLILQVRKYQCVLALKFIIGFTKIFT